MRALHFSDTHIGAASIGPIDPATQINGRVLDFLEAMDSMIDFAIQEDVDIAIFAGDAFHKPNPNQLYLTEFSKRISKLKQQCPVVMVVGNHDLTKADGISSIEVYNSLEIPGIIVGNDVSLFDIETKSGIVQVGTIPYPNRSIIPKKELNSKANISELIRKYTALSIKQLNEEVDISKPAILAIHCAVDIAKWSSEHEMFIGNEAVVTINDLVNEESKWNYVALGHIHSFQNLTEGTGLIPVIYPGSIERVNHGEEKEDKGFVIVNIVNGETTTEFVSVNPRPYKTVKVLCTKENPTERVISKIEKADLTDAVVRVIVDISQDILSSLDVNSVHNALDKSGMYCLSSLSVKPIRETMTRDVGNREFTIARTPVELLTDYLELHEKEGKELKQLLSTAGSIMEEVAYDEQG